jgi:hypothetical protein
LDGDEFTSSALVECWPLKVHTMWSGFLQIFLARERAGRKSGAVLPGPTPIPPRSFGPAMPAAEAIATNNCQAELSDLGPLRPKTIDHDARQQKPA